MKLKKWMVVHCDTEEKALFKKHLETLQNIPKVNII